MNTLSLRPSAANPASCHLPLTSLRPSLFKPPSSFSLRRPPPALPRFYYSPIRDSVQNPNLRGPDNPQDLVMFRRSDQNSVLENRLASVFNPLKATVITGITAAALYLSGYGAFVKPSIAAPSPPPATVETTATDSVGEEEREKSIEEHLLSNPDDVDGLKSLMEIKIKGKKLPEAIEILNKLMVLEPEEIEWPMMRAHLYSYNGDFELAKDGFNELVKKDPFRVEAYHGLVTVASQEESSEDLLNVEKKVEEAMKLCKKESKKSDLRDFKLLLAQVRVLEGRYDEALSVYQDLVKEEPRDFRPYLCQGIIYTLLRKNNEAEKNFEKYRRLVPKGHPYARYFDDNMLATKIFAQKAENERAMAKS